MQSNPTPPFLTPKAISVLRLDAPSKTEPNVTPQPEAARLQATTGRNDCKHAAPRPEQQEGSFFVQGGAQRGVVPIGRVLQQGLPAATSLDPAFESEQTHAALRSTPASARRAKDDRGQEVACSERNPRSRPYFSFGGRHAAADPHRSIPQHATQKARGSATAVNPRPHATSDYRQGGAGHERCRPKRLPASIGRQAATLRSVPRCTPSTRMMESKQKRAPSNYRRQACLLAGWRQSHRQHVIVRSPPAERHRPRAPAAVSAKEAGTHPQHLAVRSRMGPLSGPPVNWSDPFRHGGRQTQGRYPKLGDLFGQQVRLVLLRPILKRHSINAIILDYGVFRFLKAP